MSLAAELARVRKERNVTQGQLAAYLHVKQATVSMFESGELEITPELSARISEWVRSGKGVTNGAPRGAYRR